MAKKLPSSIPFAALLTYSPKGTSEVSQKSRTACYQIKSGREATVKAAVSRLAQLWQSAGMGSFFGSDVVLVPTPRSAPLVQGGLWPAERICEEMVAQGLGARMETALERTQPVPKSSFSRPGERPDVAKHLQTMTATPSLLTGERMTVVDDVVTKGRTLYAACALVQDAHPSADVRAFGIVRTMGYVPDVQQIVDPCTGVLAYVGGDVDRQP